MSQMSSATSANSMSQPHSKFAYLICVFIGAACFMPFGASNAASPLWEYLFGTEKMGAIIWVVSIPSPFITFFMIKLENLIPAKIRLMGSWCFQILITIGLSFFAYKQSGIVKGENSSYFEVFITLIFFTAAIFTISQASFLSYTSAFPPRFIQSGPTGMAFSDFCMASYWLILGFIVDYKKNPLSTLLAFYGVVVFSLFLCIGAFVYLLFMDFSQDYLGAASASRQNFTFMELWVVFKKISPYPYLISILLSSSLFLSPTLVLGFKSGIPSLENNWAAILLFIVALSKTLSRIMSNIDFFRFDVFTSAKNIKITVLASSAFNVVSILLLWLLQTGNLGTEKIPRSVWIDITVAVLYFNKSFWHGYLFTFIYHHALKLCEKSEKPRATHMLTFSFLVGITFGYCMSYVTNRFLSD